jgi:segregation and condensation protein A
METAEVSELIVNEEHESAALILDLDGFGGPLHLLLSLAKEQKVDLLRISISKLVDQYLAFIQKAKHERIDLAADYLVMAAWLAYLKSRMLLPKAETKKDEMSPQLLSSHLAWRLKRLEAMRIAGIRIFDLPQTGQDIFVRGNSDETTNQPLALFDADLLELLQAYCKKRNLTKKNIHKVQPWAVYSLEAARVNLKDKLKPDGAWHDLAHFIPKETTSAKRPTNASFYASLLSAGLEMAKQGDLQIRQIATYDNLYLKKTMT